MRRTFGACLIVASFLVYNLLFNKTGPEHTPLLVPDGAAVPPVLQRPITGRQVIPAAYRKAPLRFLSTAPADSLELLPGIGPVLAERLANARTGKSLFIRWGELLDVKGIGPKKLEKLQALAGQARQQASKQR